jgi:hypothetical protein
MTTTEARELITEEFPQRTVCVSENAWYNHNPYIKRETHNRMEYTITVFEKHHNFDEGIDFQENNPDLDTLVSLCLAHLNEL